MLDKKPAMSKNVPYIHTLQQFENESPKPHRRHLYKVNKKFKDSTDMESAAAKTFIKKQWHYCF
jgi:hypothetical protein